MIDPLQPKPDAELEELLEDLANGELAPERMARLDARLREDPAARHAYLERMSFEAAVASEFPVDVTLPAAPPAKPRRPLWLGIAAAVALGGLAMLFLPRGGSPGQQAGDPEAPSTLVQDESLRDKPVAAVTGLWDARLETDFGGLALGDQISRERLKLVEGRAQLTFHSGVVMELTAPARLELESPYRTALELGSASVFVPREARGDFVVNTPSSFIRDHGTRFSVTVGEDLSTELQVNEGIVEVAASGPREKGPSRFLKKREAVRIANGTIETIGYRKPASPSPSTPEREEPLDYIHWSLDDWDAMRHDSGGERFELRHRIDSRDSLPELIPGRFGKALGLDGRGRYAVSDFPGIGGAKARSVAFWVRVQPGASREYPNGIISWGNPGSSRKWQIAWNADLQRGDLGAIRVEFGNGFVVGSTDIRDGEWHHVAAIFLGGESSDAATYVRIYVDGVLEPTTYRMQNRINTLVDSDEAEPLVVGRYLGLWPGRPPFYFVGDIDEIYVTDSVLQPSDILRIMEENRID